MPTQLRERRARPYYAESDDNLGDDSSSSSSSSTTNQREQDEQMIEFNADSVHEQLLCYFCGGFFREPFTTTKCCHTFCRSCLGIAVDAGMTACPKCDTYLGRDMSKFALPDPMLQDLIDKILFPRMAAEDAVREREFYRSRGIPPKLDAENGNGVLDQTEHIGGRRESSSDYHHASAQQHARKKIRLDSLREETVFELLPHISSSRGDDDDDDSSSETIPPLEFPLIRTDSSIRIQHLKKYLVLKLDSHAGDKRKPSKIEILCHGIPLGNELSIAFVKRTVWMESSSNLRLTYRFSN